MPMPSSSARLLLEDGSIFAGRSFGADRPIAGEVVFNTGMVGYPETLTDASYAGQILVMTYPLVGNYGVPAPNEGCPLGLPFESKHIQIAGLVVCNYSARHSHWNARRSLAQWLKDDNIPAIEGVDTRSLTIKLREKGTMLGKLLLGDEDVPFFDPGEENLVEQVSRKEVEKFGVGVGSKHLVLVDCGVKASIIESLVHCGFEVTCVPWDTDLSGLEMDAVMVSNGPGDPKTCTRTIHQLRRVIHRRIPTFGICLGHQLLSLAIGADTYKLKYGHRSQNQPVIEEGTNRCVITSQNHGYAVDASSLPEGWGPWFTNLNDGTNEGIRHESLPVRSCQFHPEAVPGPVDTKYLFDELFRQASA